MATQQSKGSSIIPSGGLLKHMQQKAENNEVVILDIKKRQLPPDEILPMAGVMRYVQIARQLYCELRKSKPHLSDIDIRNEIVKQEPQIERFARDTHVTIFESMTDRDIPQLKLLRIIQLIKMRRRHEQASNQKDKDNNEAEYLRFIYGDALNS